MNETNYVLKHIIVDLITRSKIITHPRELDDLLEASVKKLMEAMTVQDRLLTEKEVAQRWPFLNCIRLRHYRYASKGPSYIKLGQHRNSRVYYKVADIEKWIVAHYQLEPFVEEQIQRNQSLP